MSRHIAATTGIRDVAGVPDPVIERPLVTQP
jgi:hypothetical protein